jgi:hypothetical protein
MLRTLLIIIVILLLVGAIGGWTYRGRSRTRL